MTTARVWMAVLGVAALAAVSGCATAPKPGDGFFDAGDAAAATRVYERELRAGPSEEELERLLFRLGVLYARPEGPTADPARAAELLHQLIERFPAGPHRQPAETLLAQLSAFAECGARKDDLQRRLEEEQAARAAAEREVAAKEAALVAAKGDLARSEALGRRLEHELAELKRIDLERRGGG